MKNKEYQNIEVLLAAEQIEKIKEISSEKGISQNELLDLIMEEFFEVQPNPLLI